LLIDGGLRDEIFSGPDATAVAYRRIARSGRPTLLLPPDAATAAKTVALYPARGSASRAYLRVLRTMSSHGLRGRGAVELHFAPQNPLVEYLATLQQAGSAPYPGIFVGRSIPPGKRLVLVLLTGATGRAVVVKLGVGARARQLTRHEIDFLNSVPAGLPGVTPILSTFDSGDLMAFTTDFLGGHPPTARNPAVAAPLLTAWIDQHRTMAVSDASEWREVEDHAPAEVATMVQAASQATVHPTLFHGDFAPWNIRVARDGSWTAVDWEAGSTSGIPGWDWFHYALDTGIFLDHMGAPELAAKLEAVLVSPAFRAYCQAAGILGLERQLLIGYLIRYQQVHPRTEHGLARISQLLWAVLAGPSGTRTSLASTRAR
jgi:hypothetical protein